MSLASLRLSSASATPILVSLFLTLAACGDAPEAGNASVGDSTEATTGNHPGEANGEAPQPGDTVAAADPADAARDSVSPSAVSDSIGFPKGKPIVPGQRYNVKSGIIELKSSFMGDMRQTIYFDDFGKKEAVYANVNLDGRTTRSVMVMADGSNVVYDPVRKSGTRIDVADALSQLGLGGIPNLSSLDANAKRELKYRPVDGRTVLGRATEGAAIEVMGTPVTVWTWEGVPLRMEASMQGKVMTVEATSLKTDVPIPAERFVVPSDVKITEFKSGQ